jgi:hypothetical protein
LVLAEPDAGASVYITSSLDIHVSATLFAPTAFGDTEGGIGAILPT